MCRRPMESDQEYQTRMMKVLFRLWRIEVLSYYRFPHVESGRLAARLLFNGYQLLARPFFAWRPNRADGLLVVATRGSS